MALPPDTQLYVEGVVSADFAGFAPASGGGTVNFLRADGTWTIPPAAGAPLTDGDKGDVTVATGGTVWTIDAGTVTTAKMGGDVTAAGKALLDDADAAAQRTTLGLGTAATQPVSAFVAPARAINTTAPISGGGDLSADRTLSIAVNGVDNTLLKKMSALTVKGNATGSGADPQDMSVATTQALLGFPVGLIATTVKKTADTVFASATPADVPQGAAGAPAMSFSVTSGRTYGFRFVSIARSDTLTVGPAMSVTFPAATVFAAVGRFAGAAVDGVDAEHVGSITTSDDAVISANVVAINTDYIFTVEGVIVPSSSGTLTLRARTETGTTNVTIRQGSYGILTDLG